MRTSLDLSFSRCIGGGGSGSSASPGWFYFLLSACVFSDQLTCISFLHFFCFLFCNECTQVLWYTWVFTQNHFSVGKRKLWFLKAVMQHKRENTFYTEGKIPVQSMQPLKMSGSTGESLALVLLCALSAAEPASRCSRFGVVFYFCLRNNEGGRNKDKKGKRGQKISIFCLLLGVPDHSRVSSAMDDWKSLSPTTWKWNMKGLCPITQNYMLDYRNHVNWVIKVKRVKNRLSCAHDEWGCLFLHSGIL